MAGMLTRLSRSGSGWSSHPGLPIRLHHHHHHHHLLGRQTQYLVHSPADDIRVQQQLCWVPATSVLCVQASHTTVLGSSRLCG